MNVNTCMRLAAAGVSTGPDNTWTQVRLSMMDSTLPWQDPDGAFVSLSESASGWTITVNYNGAGGINDGWGEVIAWKTATIADVLPARTGQQWTSTSYVELCTILSAIPADSAAWVPIITVGTAIDNATTYAMGAGNRCTTATQSGAVSMNPTVIASTPVTTAPTGSFGSVWRANIATGGYAVAQIRLTDGTLTVANVATTTIVASAVPAASNWVVGLGNGVNNPAAGNRTITATLWVRMYDLPFSTAPWIDSTGWARLSPAEFSDPSTPASDPAGFLSSFNIGAAPSWQPTLDDTGIAMIDGYDEGVRWDRALTANESSNAPMWTAINVSSAPALAFTDEWSVSAGITDPSTGPVISGPLFSSSGGGTYRANTVSFNINARTAASAWAVGNGTMGLRVAQPNTGFGGGGTTIVYLVNAAGTLASSPFIEATRNNVLTAPVMSVCATKDVVAAGTGSGTFTFDVWNSQIPGYAFQWPV